MNKPAFNQWHEKEFLALIKRERRMLWINCLILILIWALVMNLVLTTTIQRIYCKQMSETELFFQIPNNYIWKFHRCHD
jgi:hypothetical protein